MIGIQNELVSNDICACVHGRLRTDQALKRWHKLLEVQKGIEITLMEKAEGIQIYHGFNDRLGDLHIS